MTYHSSHGPAAHKAIEENHRKRNEKTFSNRISLRVMLETCIFVENKNRKKPIQLDDSLNVMSTST